MLIAFASINYINLSLNTTDFQYSTFWKMIKNVFWKYNKETAKLQKTSKKSKKKEDLAKKSEKSLLPSQPHTHYGKIIKNVG